MSANVTGPAAMRPHGYRTQIADRGTIRPPSKPIGLLSLYDLALESAQPNSRMKNGLTKVAHALAAICQPRRAKRQAA